MKVEFHTARMKKLATDDAYDGGFPREAVEKYRQRVSLIEAASDEREFYALGSLHYEKLKGKRKHQRSMRLNSQWRLILEKREAKDGTAVIRVVSIEDYH